MATMLTINSPRRRLTALLLALALAATACSSGSDSVAPTDDTSASATSSTTTATGSSGEAASTKAGVEAAQWSDTIKITVENGSFRFESNGLPDHELPDQFLVPQQGSFEPPVSEDEVSAIDTSVAVVESPVDQTITLNPVYSDEVTETNLGIIGVMISGAQLFNDYEDMNRSFVAVDDNFSVGGVSFIDSCNGHPLALNADGTGQGDYHYHGIPHCITDDVDVAGKHSTIIGVLLDGFPVYGDKDVDGTSLTSDDLDECSGHVGATPEFPEGIYHYHLTEDRSPYSIDCYHGVVDSSQTGGAGPAGGPPGAGA